MFCLCCCRHVTPARVDVQRTGYTGKSIASQCLKGFENPKLIAGCCALDKIVTGLLWRKLVSKYD